MKAMSALLAALGLFAAAFAGARDWASFVDPMVGTEGTGSEYGGMMPMTGVPFGWNKREQKGQVCIGTKGSSMYCVKGGSEKTLFGSEP